MTLSNLSQAKRVVERVKSLVEPVVEREGYELIDVEYGTDHGRSILRLYIDVLDKRSAQRPEGAETGGPALPGRDPSASKRSAQRPEGAETGGPALPGRDPTDRDPTGRDPKSGVNVEDCSHVSRTVGDLLDVEEVLEGAFNLEVSSPGLFRPLTKPAHFDRAVGERVKVKTFDKHEDRRVFTGVLRAHEDGHLLMDVDGREYRLSLKDVAKANLEPALEF